MCPPGALTCPLKFKGGQRGARAKFGLFLDCLVLKAVQRGDARGDILTRRGHIADIQRPCRTLTTIHLSGPVQNLDKACQVAMHTWQLHLKRLANSLSCSPTVMSLSCSNQRERVDMQWSSWVTRPSPQLSDMSTWGLQNEPNALGFGGKAVVTANGNAIYILQDMDCVVQTLSFIQILPGKLHVGVPESIIPMKAAIEVGMKAVLACIQGPLMLFVCYMVIKLVVISGCRSMLQPPIVHLLMTPFHIRFLCCPCLDQDQLVVLELKGVADIPYPNDRIILSMMDRLMLAVYQESLPCILNGKAKEALIDPTISLKNTFHVPGKHSVD